ncbi:MAG: helix-hairpin-helix domain-containing protein [Chloroflexota bacterium]
MGNRERALEVFAVASFLEARGANPYRVRAYRRAALRLLRLREDASVFLDEQGELALPGLGQRLRRKLGELVRTGRLSFHDELLAAEPRPIRTLMTVPGIGPRTADRLVSEAHVRGLKGLVRKAREGKLQRMHGVGPARERAWVDGAETLLARTAAARAERAAARQAAEQLRLPGLASPGPASSESTASEPKATAPAAAAPSRAA